MKELFANLLTQHGISVTDERLETMVADVSGVLLAQLLLTTTAPLTPEQKQELQQSIDQKNVDQTMQILVNAYPNKESLQKDLERIAKPIIEDYVAKVITVA